MKMLSESEYKNILVNLGRKWGSTNKVLSIMKMLGESWVYRLTLEKMYWGGDWNKYAIVDKLEYENVRYYFRDGGYLIIKFVDGTIKSLMDTDIIGYKLEPVGRLED